MADSLLLCRLFELLGGGVPSQLPQCAGAVFRLGEGADLGTPQPVIDFTVQLLGDGSRPTGHRVDNRSPTIPITIVVPSTGDSVADRLTLAAAREALFEAVSVEQFELVWRPDGTSGERDTVFDCWRAKAATMAFDYKSTKQLTETLSLNFDAYPWGRSNAPSQISFDSPVITASSQPVYQLQDFEGVADTVAVTAANTIATTAGPFNTGFSAVVNASGGSTAGDASTAAHGSVSAKVKAGASNGTTMLQWAVPATQAQQWFRIHLDLTAGYPAAATTIMNCTTALGGTAAGLMLNANGTLSMDAGENTGVITTAAPLLSGQWVRVEGYVIGDSAAGQVSVSVYPSLDSKTAAETVTSSATQNTLDMPVTFQYGICSATAGANWFYNLDDVALSSNGPVGPYQVFGAGGSFLLPVTLDDFSAVQSKTQPAWFSASETTAFAFQSALWYRDITDKKSPLWYTHDIYDDAESTFDLNTEGWRPLGYTSGIQQDFEMGTPGHPVTTANTVSTSLYPNETAPHLVFTTGAGNSVNFDTMNAHGRIGVRCSTAPGANEAFMTWEPGLTGKQWFRTYFQMNVLQTVIIGTFNATPSVTGAFLKVNSSGTLSFLNHAGSVVFTTANAMSAGVMYRLEGFVTGNASTGQVSLSLYQGDSATAIETQTSAATVNTSGNITDWTWGISSVVSGGAVVWIDDVAFSTSGAIGPAAAVSRTTNPVHSGTGSLALTAAGTSAATVAAESGFEVACTNGDTLTAAVWLRAGTVTQPVTLSVNCYAGNTLAETLTVATGTDVTTAWGELTGQVQVPYGGPVITKARIRVSATVTAGLQAHYIDDAFLAKGAVQNITGRDRLTFWLGMGEDPRTYRLWHKGSTHFAVTLSDLNGHELSFGFQSVCTSSNNQSWPFWNRLSVKIPQGSKTFRYDEVASYSIKVWHEYVTKDRVQTLHHRTSGYLAGLVAAPAAGPKRPSSDRGGDYVLYGIEGTAQTPLSLHCQLGFQSFTASTQTFDLPGVPGAALNWKAPAENPNWLQGDNADFDEKGTTGTWTGADGLAANAAVNNSTVLARSGTACMAVTPISGGTDATVVSFTTASIVPLGVPCQAGDRITLRAYARAGTTPRNITIGAEFFTSGGVSISRVNLTTAADNNTGWTPFTGRVTAPATAAYARMIITVATPAIGEVHYFDDLYISRGLQALVLCSGGGGAGGSTEPTNTTGGGGGGAEMSWETNLDLNPAANHAYTIGAGGKPAYSGSIAQSGGDSTFAGLTTTVRAHGGVGGANRITADNVDGSGGAGGSGSSNTHHVSGSAGHAGSHAVNKGGGGGGAAGDGGTGGAGGLPGGGTGGAGGSLTEPGGAGGSGNNTAGGGGLAGRWPGGGGGGAVSVTSSHPGGGGGYGKIRVTLQTYTTQSNFPTLMIHKPSARTGIGSAAVVPVGSAQDVPDGREYAIADVDGFHARYNGTYTVYAVNWSWNGSGARTITATVRQYEASGGAVSAASVSQSVTPANVLNGMVNLGDITLPVKDMAPDNTDSYFTVSLTSGNTNDRFLDLLLVDTSGQFVLINLPGGGYTDYWVDAPDLSVNQGRVLGSVADRAQAVSVIGNTDLSGGPLMLDPGLNVFTVYSPQGQPGLEGEYIPHWWHERLY